MAWNPHAQWSYRQLSLLTFDKSVGTSRCIRLIYKSATTFDTIACSLEVFTAPVTFSALFAIRIDKKQQWFLSRCLQLNGYLVEGIAITKVYIEVKYLQQSHI